LQIIIRSAEKRICAESGQIKRKAVVSNEFEIAEEQIPKIMMKFNQFHEEDRVFRDSVRSSLISYQKSGYFLYSIHEFSVTYYCFNYDGDKVYQLIIIFMKGKECLI
jgi:hypothetical protein